MSRGLRRFLSLAFVAGLLVGTAPVVVAAQGLTITTPYPKISTSADSRVSFDLKVETSQPARIDLALQGVPDSWTATLHGGGNVIGAVLTDGKDAAMVRLDVDVPADATGTTRIVVIGSDASSRVELPLDIAVEAEAEGTVSVSTDFPSLRGAAGTSFTFNLKVRNDKSEDLTYTGTGQGPAGWTVTTQPTGQSQAVSATVTAGAEAGLTVTVKPPEDASAGSYEVDVVVTVGTEQVQQALEVEITGSYSLDLSTTTQNLAAHGPSGSVTEETFRVTNTGTAPVTAVALSATPPSNWKVEFDQPTIDSIAPDQFVDVKARITPSGDAIAGDYAITVNAKGAEADDSADLRFTVETSILGAILGAVLIIGALGGLYWVFQRYGRR